MACSAAARGKIRLAAINGEQIPDGWALDNDGNPTNDPGVAMTGLILPAGAHKGSGIAIVNEVLAAVLPTATLSMDTSTRFLRQGATMFDSWKIGHTAMAINIAAFDDPTAFKGRVDDLIRRLKAGRKAPGAANILMPGEKEELSRRERLEKGIPLSAGVLAEANQVASEMGFQGLS
jgi:LDH2 family malate/lactate/ureidoglycolate dehydrogenase